MARTRIERRRAEAVRPGRAFVWGIGVGFLAAAILVLAGARAVAERGVQVVLSAEEIAQVVRTEVTRQIESDFPELAAQVKADAAASIKAQMKNKIDAGVVRISDVVVPLPPEVLNQFQGTLENIVMTSLSSSLGSLDAGKLAAQYGDRAYSMVKTSLGRELDGRTFIYSPVSWLNIPVTVRIQ